MIQTHFEVALRITVDLSKPVTASERPNLMKTIALAREVQASRGIVDPTLALVEAHVAALPAAPVSTGDGELPPREVADRLVIMETLRGAKTLRAAAYRLHMDSQTLRRRMTRYGIAWPLRAEVTT